MKPNLPPAIHRFFLPLLAGAALSCLLAATVLAQNAVLAPTGPEYRNDRVIIRVKPGITDAQIRAADPTGARLYRAYPDRIQTITLTTNLTTVGDALQTYRRSGLVEYAEPDFLGRALVTPNDTFFGDQWGLNNTGQSGGTPDADIDAPEGWDIQSTASTITVAVTDSGA